MKGTSLCKNYITKPMRNCHMFCLVWENNSKQTHLKITALLGHPQKRNTVLLMCSLVRKAFLHDCLPQYTQVSNRRKSKFIIVATSSKTFKFYVVEGEWYLISV